MSSDWRKARAGTVARIEIGGTPAREQPAYWADEDSGHPWVSIADLAAVPVRRTAEYISDLGVRYSNVKLVPEGTPIMSFKLTIGRTSVAGTDLYTNEAIASFYPAPDELDTRFLFHVLPGAASSVVTDVAIKGATLNKKSLANMEVPLPPLNEQRQIAGVLDTIDRQLQLSKSAISKLEAIGHGLMDSLLGSGSAAEGGTTDRGVEVTAPHGWAISTLDDVTAEPITYGIVQAGPHVPGGVPYVRTGDMRGDDLRVDEMLRTSRRIASSYARSTIHTDELVCAIRATVGKVLPVPPQLDGANLTQGTARIAPNHLVDSRFMAWEMRGRRVQRQIALAAKGTTFSEITLAALRKVQIAYPPLDDQRQIAAALDAHDAMLRQERNLREALAQLQLGLASDLLSGRVRVPLGVAS